MKKPLTVLFGFLALVFLALAIYYWVTPAESLPSFFPGHLAGSNHVHLKHGLASLVVAAAFGILAWFSLGKKKTARPDSSADEDS